LRRSAAIGILSAVPTNPRAEVAQSVEHWTENPGVASSILALGTIRRHGLERYNRADKRAEVAQLVEHHLAKVRVAGSSPVFRSIFFVWLVA
jgi:hypothetical protein